MKRRLIEINICPHLDQRYDTFADWEVTGIGEKLTITVSQLPNWRYEYLSAIHELLEATLCLHHGITQKQVDEFDIDYEKRRVAGKEFAACGCRITDDPGSDIHCPYRLAHTYATGVEYGLAYLLGVDAAEYDTVCAGLDKPK
jgi:hypothetical protein